MHEIGENRRGQNINPKDRSDTSNNGSSNAPPHTMQNPDLKQKSV